LARKRTLSMYWLIHSSFKNGGSMSTMSKLALNWH
jgi:hypothetical protein